MTDLNKTLDLNKQLGLATIVWGSSGYGKTSLLEAYAKDKGMKVILVEGISVQPALAAIPKITDDKVKMLLTSWLREAVEATEPTLLFIDELNRVESLMAFNLLTNVILARAYQGYKISDHVQIVAACNYSDEDVGVARELPDALYKRFMHLEWAPDKDECLKYLGVPQHYLEALAGLDGAIDIPDHKFFSESVISRLNNNPRQLRKAILFLDLAKEKGLSDYEITQGMRGLIGESFYRLWPILKNVEDKIPANDDPKFFDKIDKLYAKGKGQEIISTLQIRAENDAQVTAELVLLLGIPEITISMKPTFDTINIPIIIERNGYLAFIDTTLENQNSFKRLKANKANIKMAKQIKDAYLKLHPNKDTTLTYAWYVTLSTSLTLENGVPKFKSVS